ncbi:pyridoxamine 5'-phosphate oxidase [Terrimonas ferruginea]|uniref:pyridoxamine 5'-phosphate oxidase n=1 Tax=Terrimonas ferruginea TaxID=249 RepID=UPI0003FF24FE|nr:pyridoxamine 5'-phosphate oxidase [Terrimonas ferruginea]
MDQRIADIRINYSLRSLSENEVAADPLEQFGQWWQEARQSELLEVNAMTLATASADGVPSARIVLLKGFSPKGFVFFTNYESFKGKQLAENPKACLVFFWKELERQVRITGLVQKVSEEESEEYFQSRPAGSRLGAAVSPQSKVISSREWLEEKYAAAEKEVSESAKNIERPAHWGGYLVRPVVMEFWQGRPSRLHDRLEYTLKENGEWDLHRLAP